MSSTAKYNSYSWRSVPQYSIPRSVSTLDSHLMRFKKRQHSVIEQIRRHDRRLAIIELGKSHLAVGIDKRLLIDWSHPLESPDIKGVLSAAVSRTFALELPVRFFVLFGSLQSHHLRFG